MPQPAGSRAAQVGLTLLLAVSAAHASTNNDDDAFGWFTSPEQGDASSLGSSYEERLAHMLVMTSTLHAVSAATDDGDSADLMRSLGQELSDATHSAVTGLLRALGPDAARYDTESHHLHVDAGRLLSLQPHQLDDKLATLQDIFAHTSNTHQPMHHNSEQSRNTSRCSTANAATRPTDTTTPGNSTAMGTDTLPITSSTPPWGSGTSVVTSKSNGTTTPIRHLLQAEDGQPLREGTITLTAKDPHPLLGAVVDAVLEQKAQQKAAIASTLHDLWGIDWAALQQRIHSALMQKVDALIRKLPRVRAYNRFEQIFKIFVDKLTDGRGQGRGCTPYLFNPGGNPLPETVIFPSFSIVQTTGNCVLIPELIGNVEFPGQWSLVNSRVACLGPATEYLLIPSFYRGAGTAGETFSCPTCRNEFTVGPAVTITLLGDSKGVTTYASKAEFLATLRTHKTFPFADGGLAEALRVLQTRIQAHKKVLASRLGHGFTAANDSMSEGKLGLLGALSSWFQAVADKWDQGGPDEALEQLATKLREQWGG